MKRCTKCGIEKPLEEFNRYARSKDGHRSNCKKCAAEYNRDWHEANRERKKQYHVANREHRLRAMATYREHNREALRAYDRERVQREREKRTAYLRQYYRDNIEKRREYNRAHPELNRANHHRRRQATAAYETQPVDVAFMRMLRDDPCAYCGAPAEAIDHIRPLRYGGTNEWMNLTAACHRCNSAKRAKSLLRFLLARS